MKILHRFYLFLFLLSTFTPILYLYSIHLIFQIDPLKLHLWQHVEALESIVNKTAQPIFRLSTIVAFVFPFLAFLPKKGVKGEHGSASFATASQIKKMKLFEKSGVVLGKFGNKLLRYNEKLAVLVLAPPGEGKTAGIAIPNLLTHEGSAFVLDVKGELYNKTNEYRKKEFGSKIYKFNPASLETMKFNPFDKSIFQYLQWHEKEEIIDQIGYLIYQQKEHHDHWMEEGRSMFVMFVLYLTFKNGFTSIPDVRELIISDFSKLYGEEYQFEDETEAMLYFIREDMLKDEALPLRIREEAVSLLRKVDKELSGVISSCKSPLNIFATTTVRECFRANDLIIEDFRQESSTLYITIAEKDLERLATVNRIFIDFNLRKLLSKEPKKSDLDILGMFDEFPRFGKIPYLVDLPELGRSYKIISFLIAQDYGQIELLYGKAYISKINTSTAYKVIFPQTNAETAEMTSKYIGDFTRETRSESRSAGANGHTNKSLSTQLSGQALISKQDILNMNDGQIYILVKNYYKHPIKAKPYLYFEDRKLKKLVPHDEDK
ncbi:type IV secretory system conjugative DNA transfer family protein [Sulfurimonas sp.]|uniref:type IV secretory system conjugative DNA transfer family protein n=1 Tax=Sulfurimonas sp. TaxID=2022749 RepID=UPI002AB0341F|nr:type IV secretory system conjugative DNA transfer family protein [Sulfurimonas sp.]